MFFVFLFAPLYKIILARLPWIFVLLFVLWSIFLPGFDIPHFPLWLGPASWFFLGMFIGDYQDSMLVRIHMPKAIGPILLVVGGMLQFFLGRQANTYSENVINMLVISAYIVGIYYTLDCFITAKYRFPEFINQSFWLYVTHNILMTYILFGLRRILSKIDIVTVLLPLVAAMIVIVSSLLILKILNRQWSKIIAILCGGRG